MQWENKEGGRELPFAFTGSGSEYFRIWIVNTLLGLVTLGIYTAWAKVRTLQYFYRNTRVDNATFDYHGNPLAILKGRIIAFVLFGALQMGGYISPLLPLVALLIVAAVMPFLLVRSLRFRMANSSYRGLRFAFRGSDGDGYKAFLLWPLLAVLTLGILTPLAHQRLKQFQHGNARFGTAPFAFHAPVSAFYRVYVAVSLTGVLLAGGGAALGALLGSAVGAASVLTVSGAVLGLWLAFMLAAPLYRARLQNTIWRATTLAEHRFGSDVRTGRLFLIMLTNAILIVLTLGLFLPFARVRVARYCVESMTLFAAGPLDHFIAAEIDQVDALGDATAEWYDIDIAL
ncbi:MULTISPECIES: YjgN family protein [unclassified Cupriavidus]|uniref:YjgN family protein n=1 Tax=unclassified Cupriavidus TaxID=2640874 RepID=UPI00313C09BC